MTTPFWCSSLSNLRRTPRGDQTTLRQYNVDDARWADEGGDRGGKHGGGRVFVRGGVPLCVLPSLVSRVIRTSMSPQSGFPLHREWE